MGFIVEPGRRNTLLPWNRGSTGQYWAKSLSTGREFAVAELSGRRGDVIRSTLATDGSHLYFVWGEYESDIWVMDVVQ